MRSDAFVAGAFDGSFDRRCSAQEVDATIVGERGALLLQFESAELAEKAVSAVAESSDYSAVQFNAREPVQMRRVWMVCRECVR